MINFNFFLSYMCHFSSHSLKFKKIKNDQWVESRNCILSNAVGKRPGVERSIVVSLFYLRHRHHKVRGNKNEIREPAAWSPGHLRAAYGVQRELARAFFLHLTGEDGCTHIYIYYSVQVLFTKQPVVCVCAQIFPYCMEGVATTKVLSSWQCQWQF